MLLWVAQRLLPDIVLHFISLDRSWVDSDFESILRSFAVIIFIGVSGIILNHGLCLEDPVDLLKRLFALNVAQDISSLEKNGSILLEFNRNGGELPSTHKFCHEIARVGKQGFENFWLLIPVYCLKNLCLQLLPGRRLTRAGLLVALFSRVGLRRGFIAAGLHDLVEQGRCPGIAAILLLG